VAFITIVGVLFVPIVHRFLHKYHLDLQSKHFVDRAAPSAWSRATATSAQEGHDLPVRSLISNGSRTEEPSVASFRSITRASLRRVLRFLERKRSGIEAVTQAGRQRSIFKHVPEVCATKRAQDLCAPHFMAEVELRHDILDSDWL
jgi:hypothetical protein